MQILLLLVIAGISLSTSVTRDPASSTKAQALDSISISPAIYPSARRDESIVDDFNGTKVADPYRWMEDPDALETRLFVSELNAISEPFFAKAPNREDIRKKISELYNYEKYSVPFKHGQFYYYSHNTGLQNQSVIYRQKSLTQVEKGEVFLDPNNMSVDGTTSLSMTKWTEDGSILAYGISERGSDWVTVKFRRADKRDMDDVITGVKHSELAWLKDNSGIFYSKYPHAQVKEGKSGEKHEDHSLYFHLMGTNSEHDVLIYNRKDEPDYMIYGSVSEDGKYLIIDVASSNVPFNMLYYYELSDSKNINGRIDPKPLFDELDAQYVYVDHDDDSMLIMTNRDAPMFKLIRISLNNGSIWDVVPENRRFVLYYARTAAKDRLLITYIEDVKHGVYVHELSTGLLLYRIPLQSGSVHDIVGKKACSEVFMSFESFTVPKIIYRIDLATDERTVTPALEEWRRIQVNGLDENEFLVQQVFFESKDRTKVPMYIISSKDTQRNGNNPTMLYGYGGFRISIMPEFSAPRLIFVKHFKGVMALANIRGGGEYGENWHISGMRENKQNVFNDFIGAAEFLISNNYTNKRKLAIHGVSNGGLLVAACAQQRPDLYGAVIGGVGVLDMLRFHKFTSGAFWISEFGDPDLPKDFQFIHRYSPLHNIRFPQNGQWPSTLMMTADHDDRVVPSHTLKYAATLYEKAKLHPNQTNPLLFRVEQKAGHGHGKPIAKVISEKVDMFSFLQRVLDIKWQN